MQQEHRFDRMARKEMQRQYRMERHVAQFVHVEKWMMHIKLLLI